VSAVATTYYDSAALKDLGVVRANAASLVLCHAFSAAWRLPVTSASNNPYVTGLTAGLIALSLRQLYLPRPNLRLKDGTTVGNLLAIIRSTISG
jgi:hypothetical protein